MDDNLNDQNSVNVAPRALEDASTVERGTDSRANSTPADPSRGIYEISAHNLPNDYDRSHNTRRDGNVSSEI